MVFVHRRALINGWINRAEKETDFIFKFFCYYLAFDIAYCMEAQESELVDNQWRHVSSSNKIKKFIGRLKIDDPWATISNDGYRKACEDEIKMVEMWPSFTVDYEICNTEDNKLQLYYLICRMRNKLFHASKDPSDPTNKYLLLGACDVLKYTLECAKKQGLI